MFSLSVSLHPVWQSLGSPTEKAMTTNPILLPGKSHGQRSLVHWSPWGLQASDTTERLHFHFSLWPIGEGNGNPLMSLPGESQGRGCLVGCCLCVCTVRHDWSHVAVETAAAAAAGSPTSLQMTLFHAFQRVSSTPLYMYISSVSIPLLMDLLGFVPVLSYRK